MIIELCLRVLHIAADYLSAEFPVSVLSFYNAAMSKTVSILGRLLVDVCSPSMKQKSSKVH